MGSTTDTTKLQYTWVLWYHDPENRDYSMDGYIKVGDFSTIQQFWSVIDVIPKEAWECGMFFFMRKGYRPRWEDSEHESGGAWSKKIDASQAYTSFIDLMVHCIANEMMVNRKETLAGISISPKGQFYIVKIWNTTTTVSDKNYLNPKLTYFKITDDVTYTAHKSRPR
jgi:translation initiation factor 4E